MKSKAPLALMEQLIMLLVFAVAAALCLQVFALSGRLSRQLEAQDRAVIAVENAAETVKNVRGDLNGLVLTLGGSTDGEIWTASYDAAWQPSETAAYTLTVTPAPSPALLGMADVTAADANGEILFSVTVSWQEAAHE